MLVSNSVPIGTREPMITCCKKKERVIELLKRSKTHQKNFSDAFAFVENGNLETSIVEVKVTS